ncbi:MAG: hypothetical protein ACLR95_05470 [Enterococcus avium]
MTYCSSRPAEEDHGAHPIRDCERMIHVSLRRNPTQQLSRGN